MYWSNVSESSRYVWSCSIFTKWTFFNIIFSWNCSTLKCIDIYWRKRYNPSRKNVVYGRENIWKERSYKWKHGIYLIWSMYGDQYNIILDLKDDCRIFYNTRLPWNCTYCNYIDISDIFYRLNFIVIRAV